MSASASAAVVGAGPAGLMAAETLAAAGVVVTVYDRMPSVGRKLLMAGRGGLNLTHSEPFDRLRARYGAAAESLRPALERFPPEALVDWTHALGQPTFVGSSGRVFPRALKASPLLRAWLRRLSENGVVLRTGWRWTGWCPRGRLRFEREDGERRFARPDVTVLALGGASWPRLGSDGAWAGVLADIGVDLAPLRPANCGFEVDWSPHMRARFAGSVLKTVAATLGGVRARGEVTITSYGVEGGPIYALASLARNALAAGGEVTLELDLKPDLDVSELVRRLSARGRRSLGGRLRRAVGLAPVAVALMNEGVDLSAFDASALAQRIKATPIRLNAPRPIARAISTAGGVTFEAIDADYGLRAAPGVFVAGEMLDWEAPTGGYLLQASFATGRAAACGALAFVANPTGERRLATIDDAGVD